MSRVVMNEPLENRSGGFQGKVERGIGLGGDTHPAVEKSVGYRQAHRENGSHPRRRGHLDGAAVRLYDPFCDRQPQARPFCASCSGFHTSPSTSPRSMNSSTGAVSIHAQSRERRNTRDTNRSRFS